MKAIKMKLSLVSTIVTITLSASCGKKTVSTDASTKASSDNAKSSSQDVLPVLFDSNAVSLEKSSSSLLIDVPYAGKISNICGLKIVLLGGSGIIDQTMVDQIIVSIEDNGSQKNVPVIYDPAVDTRAPHYDFSQIVLQEQLFSRIVQIKSKDGQALSSISSLKDGDLTLVSTPCERK